MPDPQDEKNAKMSHYSCTIALSEKGGGGGGGGGHSRN